MKTSYLDNCKGKKCQECREYQYWIVSKNSESNISEGADITAPVESSCIPNKYFPIHHLIGNAGEWTNESNILAGGSWDDQLSEIDTVKYLGVKDFIIRTDVPTRSSGFRNVFQWKSVKDLKPE